MNWTRRYVPLGWILAAMENENQNTATTDALFGPEQVDEVLRQLRTACVDALNHGQPLDIEAVLHALLRAPGPQRARQPEIIADARKDEPRPNDVTPTRVHDDVGATISEPAKPAPGATLEYEGAPANLDATQDAAGPPKPTFSRPGGSRKAGGHMPASFTGYDILGLLGKGGMGVVYKARQRALKRIVALKMIRAEDASETELARFRIEAEAVAQLQHPNIVQVYEVGEDTGRPYLSLEYIDGGSLKDKLGGKPQPVLHAAQLIQLLAQAMSAAHHQGIIHRDLKPANVLLMRRHDGSTELRHDTTFLVEQLYGTPKITDFGLAKRLEEDDGQTRSGSILGTPSYMAPEQAMARGKEVGPLADQYALGAMLYEMLTGRPPHEGTTVLETLEQVRTQEPVPPSRLQPKVPRDLETICLKCLQKEPQKRYADCAALAEDLRRFVAGDPILARPVSAPERLWRLCRRNPKVAALSATVVSLVLIGLVGLAAFNLELREEKAQTEFERNQAVTAKQFADEARQRAEQKEQEALDQRGLALATLGDLVTNVQGAIEHVPGQQGLQKKLLKIAMDTLERVSENPKAKISLKDSTLAAAHMAMGRLYQRLGDRGQADKEYRLAEAAYAEQVRADPDNARCRGNQALALMALGWVNLQSSQASAFFKKAYDVLAPADSARAGTQLPPQKIREYRADALHGLGVVIMDSNPRQGRAYYEQCVKLSEEVADFSRSTALRNLATTEVGLLAAPAGQAPWLALPMPLAVQGEMDSSRRRLAQAYLFLGSADLKLYDFSSTQALYVKALKLSQELAEAHPDDLWGLRTLAGARERLGDLYLRGKRPGPAAEQYAGAAKIYQELLQRDPAPMLRKEDLSRILYSIATTALARGDRSLADQKYHASLTLRAALARGRNQGSLYRDYMVTLARCGQYQQAAQMARQVREHSGTDVNSLIDVACCFAICSDMASSRQHEELAGRSLEALRAAIKLGYRNVYNLETEPDLDAVRDRPGFQAILNQLRHAPIQSRGAGHT